MPEYEKPSLAIQTNTKFNKLLDYWDLTPIGLFEEYESVYVFNVGDTIKFLNDSMVIQKPGHYMVKVRLMGLTVSYLGEY